MIQALGAGWVRFIFEQAVDSPVYLVGDFNGWDEEGRPMERLDNGTHEVILKLQPGEYEFKYKCGAVWFNDTAAHKYAFNCWGSENSVVVVQRSDDRVTDTGSFTDTGSLTDTGSFTDTSSVTDISSADAHGEEAPTRLRPASEPEPGPTPIGPNA